MNTNIKANIDNNLDEDEIHVVFSTDCSFFQDWYIILFTLFHNNHYTFHLGKHYYYFTVLRS